MTPAVLVLYLVSGYTLVKALFPGRGRLAAADEVAYLIFLTLLMGAVVAILYGFALVALSQIPGQPGFFTDTNFWGGVAILTAGFFGLGWWRGAYPLLGRKSAPGKPAIRFDHSLFEQLETLGRERDELKSAMAKGTTGGGGQHMKARLTDLEAEIRRLEATASEAME